METSKEINEKWNDSWGDSVINLVRCPLDPATLEGRSEKDRDIIRRARCPGRIRKNSQYDELLKIVSEWGYCVESPLDFDFKN